MDWNEFLSPNVIWIVVGLILLIAEFAVPGLVIFFFGLGALLVGAICSVTDLSLNSQLAVFLVSSVGLLISLRQSVSHIFQGGTSNSTHVPEDTLDVVGERATVIRTISPNADGKVEFHGSQWQAAADQTLSEGTIVEVVGRDNLTLMVKPLDRE